MAKITRIAGPLVEADEMEGVKMHEVVKVGEEELVGEVIRLEEDVASIQVYENTEGLTPHEPVKSTGRPLSVELGPGVIKSIYDGIQRPLELIEEEAGDFITRGISVSPLDKKKKWKFIPKVEEGDEVVPGDILGEIPESKIIKNRVMVPHGIRGKVYKIEEGKFTVEEPVCVVEGKEEKHEINSMQVWPVRKQRPYQKKLPLDVPLISGQRILDTFFPLAKGGTAAIPGGFGTGKCMTGETPVMLGDGSLSPIKKVFEENHGRGEVTKGKSEEYTELEEPLQVLSFEGGKFKRKEATVVYKGKTNSTVKIKTRTGREVEVTPAHKLQVMTPEMEIVEKRAGEIEEGEFILSPRKLPNPEENPKLSLEIGKMRVGKEGAKRVCKVLEKLSEKEELKEIAEVLEEPYHNLIEYKSGRNRPQVEFVRKLEELIEEKIPINKVKGERQSKEVKLPKEVTPEFAEFL